MDNLTIALVNSRAESDELDLLLREVLWKPLGLPRDVRGSFKLRGECTELIAKVNTMIVGGLVANWTAPSEIEIRHIVVKPEVQSQGIGSQLILTLISIISTQGCSRIHAIARNTSAGFFRKQGFAKSSGEPPEHPVFNKHGITFELMERHVGIR